MRISTPALGALLLLLAACTDQDLYGKLGERQANEMAAVLRHAGLQVEKQPQEGGTFVLRTRAADFAQAVQLLHAAGYPREGHDNLGQVFKKEGLVSTPLEERARLNYALSQEIATTLNAIDGVVMARVHVAMPERDPLAESARPASASVFVKHRAGVDLAPRIGEIKALVVNAIEGLPYDKVSVVFFPADPWPATPSAAAEASHALPGPALWGLGAALVLTLVGAGGWAWQAWRRRQPEAAASAVVLKLPTPAHASTARAGDRAPQAEGRRAVP